MTGHAMTDRVQFEDWDGRGIETPRIFGPPDPFDVRDWIRARKASG